jgi:drug/metabolite transporter (DMT)-like permease
VHPGPASPLPRSVRWSVWCWLAAVACGVLEALLNAVTSPDYDVAVQLSIRTVVYVLVTLLIVRLRRGERWVRLALTVLLGVVGLVSLLAEPISWLIAGGAPASFLAAADAPTVAVVALRAIHVVAVVCALSLVYTPMANRFFK